MAAIRRIPRCSLYPYPNSLRPKRHRTSSRSRQSNCFRNCSRCDEIKVRPRIQPTIPIRLRGSSRQTKGLSERWPFRKFGFCVHCAQVCFVKDNQSKKNEFGSNVEGGDTFVPPVRSKGLVAGR